MQIGIFGLKNAGKSTLFDILTGQSSLSSAYGAAAGERQGVMTIPDERLKNLQKVYGGNKLVNPSLEITDLAPIQSSKNSMRSDTAQLLEKIKNFDALVHIVRQFSNPAVPFDEGGPDPLHEKNMLDTELILMDLSIVENRLERIEKMKHKIHDFYQHGEPELLQKCKEHLEEEKPLIALDLDANGEKMLRGFQFITLKPRITVINIDESEISNSKKWIERFENQFPAQKSTFEAVCALTEVELPGLSEKEQEEFRKELQIEEPAQRKITQLLMNTLQLMRFLTASEEIAQSWIIPKDTSAKKAAGVIHTDLERGFIRAEVVSYSDLIKYGNIAHCKEHGSYKLEGKEYIVQEGDVIHFRFNI